MTLFVLSACGSNAVSFSKKEYKGTVILDSHSRSSRRITVEEKKEYYLLTLEDVQQEGDQSQAGGAVTYEMLELSDSPIKVKKDILQGEEIMCQQKVNDTNTLWHQFIFKKDKIEWKYTTKAENEKEAQKLLKGEEYAVLK